MQISNRLPDKVELGGKIYNFNASFDNVINIIDLINDNDIDNTVKVDLSIEMIFGKEQCNVDFETKKQLFFFFFAEIVNQGKKDSVPLDLSGKPIPNYQDDVKKNYSLKHDADYIFSSFMQAYHINLFKEQGKMHWFEFQALLNGLPDDTKFKQITQIRSWKSDDKQSYASKMRELQAIYQLPDD